MRSDVLKTLALVGCRRSVDGTVRMYHATSAPAATQILKDGYLRPSVIGDIAEQTLRPGRGSVFLSTSASIADDLATGEVVLAVNVDAALEAEVSRDGWGEPPRAEIVFDRAVDNPVPVAFAARLDQDVKLDADTQTAIEMFRDSDVGRQLADPAERHGRCGRASERFISALRHVNADTPARLIQWAWAGSFHVAVELDGNVIDWTASQFAEDPDLIAAMPWPLIETRPRVDLQMLADFDADAGCIIHPDDRFQEPRRTRILPWHQVRARIPDRGTEQQRLFRN